MDLRERVRNKEGGDRWRKAEGLVRVRRNKVDSHAAGTIESAFPTAFSTVTTTSPLVSPSFPSQLENT
jgi:hypothetical protein